MRFDRAPAKTRDPDAYAAFLAEQHPVGDPDHVVGRVAESCQASGVRRVLFFVEGGGPERTLANITALGRDVLPRLRAGVR